MESYSHTEIVHASLERCFDTLVDFANYPQVFSMISAASVEHSDPGAGLWTVRYELNAILKTISYTLDYRGQRPERLEWKMARGDLKDIEGVYVLEGLEDELTEATCTQALEVGVWVPGPIRKIFEESALATSVREFKKAAERDSS